MHFRTVTVLFSIYLLSLLLFTFFPRPVLETGDPSAISAFLRTHANFFYKILYADTTSVAIGNYFMLTPFMVMAQLVYPKTPLWKLFLTGVGVSAVIEISQIFIPGRVSDPVDFVSNVLSLVWGLALGKIWSLMTKKMHKPHM